MRRSLTIFVILWSGFPISSSWAQQVGDVVVAIKGPSAQSGRNKSGVIPRGTLLTVKDVNGDRFVVNYVRAHQEVRGSIDRADVIPFSKALDFFTDEIQRKPTAEVFHIRGVIWHVKREYEIAIGDYSDGIRLDPHYKPNYSNRGDAWSEKQEYDKALADYNEAIRLDPRDSSAYFDRGVAWQAKGEDDKAIKDFTKALSLDPDDSVAYNHRGNAWLRKQDYANAIVDYSQAIRLKPTAIAHFNRGNTFIQNKAYDKALTDFDEATRLDPEYPYAYYQIAWISATCPDARLRDGKRAVKAATKACELTKWKRDYCLDALAAAYAEAGDFDAAIKWETKAIETATRDFKLSFEARLNLYRDHKPLRMD